MEQDATDDIEILDRETCLALLGNLDIGRCAWVDEDGRIIVIPVNFVLFEGHIVFRSNEGAKLSAAGQNGYFSFEVDDLEPAVHGGWSVLVQGRAQEVTDPEERSRLQGMVHPWSRVERLEVVRISVEYVTGRRIRLHAGGVSVVQGRRE